jgi:hypothetical protein
MVNFYRRFLPKIAQTLAPLTNLLKGFFLLYIFIEKRKLLYVQYSMATTVRSIKFFSGARITMSAPLLGAKLAVASFGPRTRKNKTQYLEKVEKYCPHRVGQHV